MPRLWRPPAKHSLTQPGKPPARPPMISGNALHLLVVGMIINIETGDPELAVDGEIDIVRSRLRSSGWVEHAWSRRPSVSMDASGRSGVPYSRDPGAVAVRGISRCSRSSPSEPTPSTSAARRHRPARTAYAQRAQSRRKQSLLCWRMARRLTNIGPSLQRNELGPCLQQLDDQRASIHWE